MKIISISGSGRSGSTVLSILLTQGDDVRNLGQVRDLWSAYVRASPCSCGEPLPSCSFWSQVVRTSFGARPRRHLAKMQRRREAFRRDAAAIPDWTDAAAIARLARAHVGYVERLGAFVSAAAEVADVDALLDASKSPDIALALGVVAGQDLRVLDLVRDPRAVAVSWERKRDREAAIEATDAWAERQRILAIWARALGDRFLEMRYEDLVSSPRLAVGSMLAWAGLQPVPDLFTTDSHAEVSWDRQHLFPLANEAVLAERRTSVDVIASSEWREHRYHLTHEMVESRVGDVLDRSGYPRTMSSG